MLTRLGDPEKPLDRTVQAIFANAATFIREPVNLDRLVTAIDDLHWFPEERDSFGDLYEGLLQKNAEETKRGAGQYFTPRVLNRDAGAVDAAEIGRDHPGSGRQHRRVSDRRRARNPRRDRRVFHAGAKTAGVSAAPRLGRAGERAGRVPPVIDEFVPARHRQLAH